MTQQPDPNAPREGEPEAGATPPPAPPTYGQPSTPAPPAPPGPPAAPAPGGYPPQGSYGPPAGAAMSESDERMWAMLGHLGGIVLGFIAPLVVWLVYRERSAFLDDQGKEALNFQITVAIATVVGFILIAIFIGGIILLAVWAANLILSIMAGIAANRGERYRYPVTLRLIK